MPYIIDGKLVEDFYTYWAQLCDKHGWSCGDYEQGPGERWDELDDNERYGLQYRYELEAGLDY